jgi:polyether ionophore transport system ATP-binding protein
MLYVRGMEAVIEVRGLEKRFGPVVALDGLDLSVAPGEVHGFLGPNGAGKSTTIRILLGLIRANGGEARVLGGDPWRDATELHKRISYVPGDVALWPMLSGGEVIDLLGRIGGGLDGQRKISLIDRFELDPTRKCKAYSKGNRQKVALIAALASRADLLILDEPSSGLDPLMEAEFGRVIGEDTGNGRTVLLASHILSEVEALCERVSIVRAGKIVETGTLEDLRHLTRTTIEAGLTTPPPGLGEIDGVHDLSIDGTKVRFQVDQTALESVLRVLTGAGVVSLVSRPPTLEELFLRHYQKVPS